MTEQQFFRMVAERTELPVYARETTLDELGLDSLELLELMIALDIPDEAMADITTLGELFDHLPA